MAQMREKDDGYRGYVFNPDTGRTFRCTNALKAMRVDLLRVPPPGTEPTVTTSKASRPAVEAPPVADEVAQDASEAEQAIDEILAASRETDDKAALKALGAQIGVKLNSTMNLETMRDRIETQVAAIKAATE